MKNFVFVGVLLLAFAGFGMASPILDVSVSAGATFFQQMANDRCTAPSASAQCTSPLFFTPTYIALSDLGAGVGDTLSITIDNTSTVCLLPLNMDSGRCGSPNLAGIFTSQGVGGYDTNPSDSNRIGGAVSRGSSTPGPYVALSNQQFTFQSSTDNITNADLFAIPFGQTFQITIPQGATFLALGVFDSWLADNSGNITVTVTDPSGPTPEPATLALCMGGIGILALARKLRG